MDVFEVLRELDEDSDSDFDGYIEEDDWDECLGAANDDGNDEPQEEESPSTAFTSTSLPDYQQRSGCTVDMADKDPVDFFHLMVTDQMLEGIVDNTNLYAEQFLESANIRPKSRANLWDKKPHNLAELKKFLSLVIVMGLIHFPSIEDYWVTSWPFSNNIFSDVLKRDRFTLLLRFLHLNDNSKYIPKGQPGHDPLFKIRPFMDVLIENFRKSYIPVESFL